jgi:hypothetical protein
MDQAHRPPPPPLFQPTDGQLLGLMHKQNGRKPLVKRTVKYLSVCSNPRAYNSVLKGAPDEVIKAICNAALNIEQGDIRLSPAQRHLFSAHREKISNTTSRIGVLKSKRNIIQSQKSGFPSIPILLGAALCGLGPQLFGKQTWKSTKRTN